MKRFFAIFQLSICCPRQLMRRNLCRVRARSLEDPRLRVFTLGTHQGQSSALDSGFRAVRGDVVATLDADGQNDPADLPRLLGLLAAGIAAVRRSGPSRVREEGKAGTSGTVDVEAGRGVEDGGGWGRRRRRVRGRRLESG